MFSGIEKVYASDGYVNFSSINSLVSQYRKTLQGNPSVLCFRKFPVAKKFMDKRGYQEFASKNFCLTVPKNFVGEPYSVSLISGIEKFYAS